jgi:C4-dicarboxylate transporter DctQ subunit
VSSFDQILRWIENTLAGLSLGGAAALAIVQVILRYVFDTIIFWSEEAIIYLVIFSTFVGAAITLRYNEHVNVDILGFLLGQRGKRYLATLGAFVTVVYCVVIGGFAWVWLTEPALRNTLTPALKLPLWVVGLSLPIGLTLMFLRSVEIAYRAARGRQTFPEAEEEHGEELI